MKTYRVIEKVTDLRCAVVEAKNKKEAKELFENGGYDTEFIDCIDSSVCKVEVLED